MASLLVRGRRPLATVAGMARVGRGNEVVKYLGMHLAILRTSRMDPTFMPPVKLLPASGTCVLRTTLEKSSLPRNEQLGAWGSQ
jgi:hypothetical protein